jgi:hypothetical protein
LGLDSALSLGASLAGKLAHEAKELADKAKKLAGAALSSDIGKNLCKGDAGGALQAVFHNLGF